MIDGHPFTAAWASDIRRCSQREAHGLSHGMKIVESSPEVMGGASVFRGTRVPVQTLFDYLEAGDGIADFLSDFPTVSPALVKAALRLFADHLAATAST